MNKLHISDDARQDLAEIKQYIAEDLDSPSAAAQTVKAILKGIARLKEQLAKVDAKRRKEKQFARRNRLFDEANELREQIRRLEEGR